MITKAIFPVLIAVSGPLIALGTWTALRRIFTMKRLSHETKNHLEAGKPVGQENIRKKENNLIILLISVA
jgi:uncharacterized membrane protein